MTQLQQQPNRWSCLPTAFAMAFNIPVAKFIKLIGHDGSEIIFPDMSEPYSRRSFHIQEMLRLSLINGFSVTELQPKPVSSVRGELYALPYSKEEFEYYLKTYTGVLVGKTHAVYWDGTYILDPDCGRPYPIDKFNINMFFVINKI